MRAHRSEARVDDTALVLQDFVDGHAHFVVDATPCNTTKRRGTARVRIKQRLVTLARVGHQPERSTRAQLRVHDLQQPVDAADNEPLFAPIELEGFSGLEGERH